MKILCSVEAALYQDQLTFRLFTQYLFSAHCHLLKCLFQRFPFSAIDIASEIIFPSYYSLQLFGTHFSEFFVLYQSLIPILKFFLVFSHMILEAKF